MIKKLFANMFFWIINLLIAGTIVFLFNTIWELDKSVQKNEMAPMKNKPPKRRARPRNYEMEEEWYLIEDKQPPEDAYILVELDGCKLFNYMKMKVRYGEGLGHIKRWRYLTPKELALEKSISLTKKEGSKLLW